MEWIVTTSGWLGAGLLLLAYAAVSEGRLHPAGAGFQVLNLLGSAGLTVNSGCHRAWPSAALNAVWILVGLMALRRFRVGGDAGSQASDPVQARSDRSHR
jgi:hypothetical protein